MKYVIDASVGIQWEITEPLSGKAGRSATTFAAVSTSS